VEEASGMVRPPGEGGESVCELVHHYIVVRSIIACNAEHLWATGESLASSYLFSIS